MDTVSAKTAALNLAEKAAETKDPNAAVSYSQAALNLANVHASLKQNA